MEAVSTRYLHFSEKNRSKVRFRVHTLVFLESGILGISFPSWNGTSGKQVQFKDRRDMRVGPVLKPLPLHVIDIHNVLL